MNLMIVANEAEGSVSRVRMEKYRTGCGVEMKVDEGWNQSRMRDRMKADEGGWMRR